MRVLLTTILLCMGITAFAQPTQVVRGKVMDLDSKIGLPGVKVMVAGDSAGQYTVGTDVDGFYRIPALPVGRHAIIFSYISYASKTMDIVVTSGKEVILDVDLEESLDEMEEVVVLGRKRGEVLNEMATVSAREFSVEESNRYAGSRGDPARMASNFAGVQGADDSRNDIVVRGNSPLGVLYRVEGINIPNPNHFAISGSQGGPVTILNNKMLANSDFFTSAFPAEYGNSNAAVFDLRYRPGNNEKHEFTGQLGFLGTELTGEGPLSKDSKSSYLFAYRYSTLTLFSFLGIDIGTNAVPKYQDFSFKLNFPTKNQGNWSVFGLGGLSDIDIVISTQTEPSIDLYAENDRDQYFGSRMGVVGARYTKSLNDKTFFTTTVAASVENQHSHHDKVTNRILDANEQYILDSINVFSLLDYNFNTIKYGINTAATTKRSKKLVIKYGVNADILQYNFVDSVLVNDTIPGNFRLRWNSRGVAALVQPFFQMKYKLNENLTMNAGWHVQYLSLSNSLSWLEPRFGLKWRVNETQSINFGMGIHSQMQPLYTYLYSLDSTMSTTPHNINMDFTKSNHFVLGYDNALSSSMRLKAEVYYQNLYGIPVSINPSSFSLVNQGSGFARFFPDTLQNTGTGYNYGLELTVEKFFSNRFYFLVTGSLYESRYSGSDGIDRNTDYNGNFAVNGLIGKEWEVGKKSVISLGGKITWAGGKRYGILDSLASAANQGVIFADDRYNEFQFPDYFRADIKLNYTINSKKVTHEIAIDLLNITDQQNILGITYTPDQPDGQDFRENFQLGRLPLFYYRLDF